jgi:putative chitinase
MLITLEQLIGINEKKNKEKCKYYFDAINYVLPQYGISTPIRLSHFFAQILHESGNLEYKEENLNYSAQGLLTVFPKYFPNEEIANEYARNPEKIANRVYGGRMGNGDEDSGDGWKYRGRGLIQLTGHDNYKACGTALDLDLLGSPDLLCQDPEAIVYSACWYWSSRNLNELADKDYILGITKKINGGTNGLKDREHKLDVAKRVLKCENS